MTREKDIINGLVIAFVLFRLFSYFVYDAPLLQTLSALILIIVPAYTIPKLSITSKLVMTMMLAVGVSLLVYVGADAAQWQRAVLQNGTLIMMLVCVPMISMPLHYRDYQRELKTLVQIKMRNVMSFLTLVSAFTHILAVVMNIGAIIISYTLMRPIASAYNADHQTLKTVSRGYFSSGFWSPAWGSVIIYAIHTDVHWVRVIPVGIAFGVLFNAISLLGINSEVKRSPEHFQAAASEPDTKVDKPAIYTMALIMVFMIGSIIVINAATGWSLMLVVTFVSLTFPLLAALVQRLCSAYRSQLRQYYDISLVKAREQVALFTLVGFLAFALNASGVVAVLVELLPDWLHNTPVAMVAAIILTIALPTLVGVHPTATGTALAVTLQPAVLGLASYTFALALLTGWVIGTLIAPFGVVAMLLSNINGRSIYANSLLLNWKFALVCVIVFSPLISLIGPLMG